MGDHRHRGRQAASLRRRPGAAAAGHAGGGHTGPADQLGRDAAREAGAAGPDARP